MYFIFSKEKFCAYLVSILTVVVLFGIAAITNGRKTIETSSKIQRLLPIYDVETNDKKIAFTMNCAWSGDDIDKILDTLDKENIKITFFVVGDWIDKNEEALRKMAGKRT